MVRLRPYWGDGTVKLTFEVEVETEKSRDEVLAWINDSTLDSIGDAIQRIIGTGIGRVRLLKRR